MVPVSIKTVTRWAILIDSPPVNRNAIDNKYIKRGGFCKKGRPFTSIISRGFNERFFPINMYNASSGHRLSWPIKEYLIKNPVSIIKENKIGETFSNSNLTF